MQRAAPRDDRRLDCRSARLPPRDSPRHQQQMAGPGNTFGGAAMDRRNPGSSFTQRGRVWWFGTAGALLFVLVTGMALPLDRLWNLHTAAAPSVIAPKVLTVSMFQTGDPLTDGSGEASVWVKNDTLDQ